jgi:hypothetical protein
MGGSGRWDSAGLPLGVAKELSSESLVFEKDVGGVSYCTCPSVPEVRMLEPIEERLNASSITCLSSELTFLASFWMYLVGLSCFRTLIRGISARSVPRDLDRRAEEGFCVLDR